MPESRQQLTAILRGLTDGITVQDPSGVLRYANDVAAKLVGFSTAEELMATPVGEVMARFEVFAEDGSPLALAEMPGRLALLGTESERTVGFRVKGSAEVRWSLLRGVPVLDAEGNVIQALNIFRDITERRAFEAERDRHLQSAQEAVRDREQLMAVLSHDLRNPLSTIAMASELLVRAAAPESAEKAKRASGNIQRAVRRMERLIHDLLDLARIEGTGLSIERAQYDAASLVAESIDLHNAIAGEKQLRLLNETSGAALLSCDRERVLQLLSNLIDNALKFTPAGGTVRVGARPAEGHVELWVHDDGPGVPEAQRAQIFERYWQARRDRKGLGLGLAIARSVVEAHGGRIWVEGDQGARFVFTLPQR